MTSDQITSLAKQAGFLIDEAPISQPYVIQATRYKIDDELQRFYELVRNEVLEEAALCADEHKHFCYEGDIDWHEAGRIAAAIRNLKS